MDGVCLWVCVVSCSRYAPPLRTTVMYLNGQRAIPQRTEPKITIVNCVSWCHLDVSGTPGVFEPEAVAPKRHPASPSARAPRDASRIAMRKGQGGASCSLAAASTSRPMVARLVRYGPVRQKSKFSCAAMRVCGWFFRVSRQLPGTRYRDLHLVSMNEPLAQLHHRGHAHVLV